MGNDYLQVKRTKVVVVTTEDSQLYIYKSTYLFILLKTEFVIGEGGPGANSYLFRAHVLRQDKVVNLRKLRQQSSCLGAERILPVRSLKTQESTLG